MRQVASNVPSEIKTSFQVHRAALAALLFCATVAEICPTSIADDAKVSALAALPDEWVTEHYAEAFREGTRLYLWFRKEQLPLEYKDEVNEDPNLPTEIFFGGRYGWKTKLDLHELCRYSGIRSLMFLEGDRLEPSALAEIAKCHRLTVLVLWEAPIDDESLKTLSMNLKRLKVLDVSMSDISDDSIATLTELSELEMLNVSGTNISLRGVEVLRKRMPSCKVFSERWPTPLDFDWQSEAVKKWEAAGKIPRQDLPIDRQLDSFSR